ncbi:uncharacterized protein LOC111320329, partial [Stylophora pistillata]|uniref:uncharacterized protein LOC111320329 n=1 Tax=Stylophora pistillata TaxID=50429 RepID=UPI000C0456C3
RNNHTLQTFVVALGTNKGDQLFNLRQAVKEFKADQDISLIATSRIYRTQAILLPGSLEEWNIPFLNAAVKIKTSLSEEELLGRLKAIEVRLGRPLQYNKWSPRVIDLDILSCGQKVLKSEILTIPHALLLERSFALAPLLDVAPEWRHPEHPDTDLELLLERLDFVELTPYPLEGTRVMGVINLTPISMSGPNKSFTDAELREEIVAMVNDGAEIIDVGAESTRPGAEPLTPETEWQRLQLFLRNLKGILSDSRLLIHPKISIDTYHAETVQKLKDYDIDIINDVAGVEKEKIISVLKGTKKKYVLMHNTGRAGTNHLTCSDGNIVDHLISWFEQKTSELIALGLTRAQIIIDPG